MGNLGSRRSLLLQRYLLSFLTRRAPLTAPKAPSGASNNAANRKIDEGAAKQDDSLHPTCYVRSQQTSGTGSRWIRVMSFNIRGAFRRGDGVNAWCNRAAPNVAAIKNCAPDLIGFQELQDGNLKTYQETLPGYERLLGPKAGNRPPHEFNAIFFRPSRLELLKSGGFWLSETPEQHSASWRARTTRCANWAEFRCHESGVSFLHLNTHLDHLSKRARTMGSELIRRRLREVRTDDEPAIVTGDFNCPPGSATYRAFVQDGFVDTFFAASEEADANTFHAFGGVRQLAAGLWYRLHHGGRPMRIDMILLNDPGGHVKVESHRIVRNSGQGSQAYPSDHYPVFTDLSLSLWRSPG